MQRQWQTQVSTRSTTIGLHSRSVLVHLIALGLAFGVVMPIPGSALWIFFGLWMLLALVHGVAVGVYLLLNALPSMQSPETEFIPPERLLMRHDGDVLEIIEDEGAVPFVQAEFKH